MNALSSAAAKKIACNNEAVMRAEAADRIINEVLIPAVKGKPEEAQAQALIDEFAALDEDYCHKAYDLTNRIVEFLKG